MNLLFSEGQPIRIQQQNPKHFYSEVSPIELSATYSQANMYRAQPSSHFLKKFKNHKQLRFRIKKAI